jgi:hypothetical protein
MLSPLGTSPNIIKLTQTDRFVNKTVNRKLFVAFGSREYSRIRLNIGWGGVGWCKCKNNDLLRRIREFPAYRKPHVLPLQLYGSYARICKGEQTDRCAIP